MKASYYTLVNVLALLAFPNLLNAQGNTVAFSNGVFRAEEQAKEDLDALVNKLKKYYQAKGMTPDEFDKNFAIPLVAYNQTKCKHSDPSLTDISCLRDLYEAIVHPVIPTAIRIEDSRFWRFLSGAKEVLSSNDALISEIFAATAAALEPIDTTRSDLERQLGDYRAQFSAHRKVVVVAHSQGNFFANDIYGELTDAEQQSFGVVAVATPANFVAGGGPWTTFFEDFIWLSPVLPPPLPPNASNIHCVSPFACHDFVESYLAEEDRDPRILPDIDATFARLVTPADRSLGFVEIPAIPTGSQPLGLATADFDADGRTDIAVAIYDHGSGDHLSIMRNVGSAGHLGFDIPVDIPTGRGPQGIAAGDLNNDGKLDIVVANADSLSVSVLQNDSIPGLINFQSVLPQLSIFGTPHRVAIADFDGDGRQDLVVTSNSGRRISVFHHASDPNVIAFDYHNDYGVNDYLNDLAVADIDGDARPEILVPRTDSGLLTTFLNSSSPGSVQFVDLAPVLAGTAPIRGIAVGDLNSDYKVDFVVAGIGGVGIFENFSTPGAFYLQRIDVPTGTNPDAVAMGDLDKDGRPDVVAANPDENTISILRNTSMGGSIVLTPLQLRPATGLTPIALALGDMDSDGWLDIVVANHEGSSISILLNAGSK